MQALACRLTLKRGGFMNGTNRPIVITLVVVVLAIAALVAYFFSTGSSEEVVTEQIAVPRVVPAEPAPAPQKPPAVMTEPVEEMVVSRPSEVVSPPEEPVFVLPLLDDSDQLIRDGAVSLTRHEGINTWLGSDELIRKFVAFADNVAHGQVAKSTVRALAPKGPFLARPVGDQVFEMDPASYDRYDRFVDIAISVDSRRAAEFYHLLRPLVEEAYGELGYGDRAFDDVVFQSAARLLETPVIEEPIRLVRPVVMYRYEDEKLENLSAAQKQMIRMGPENTRKLQAKIRDIMLELRAILDK